MSRYDLNRPPGRRGRSIKAARRALHEVNAHPGIIDRDLVGHIKAEGIYIEPRILDGLRWLLHDGLAERRVPTPKPGRPAHAARWYITEAGRAVLADPRGVIGS